MTLTSNQPTTKAAPSRGASFMPGDIVTINNPGTPCHGRVGRVRRDVAPFARIDFADMETSLIAHEHLTKGERA